MNLISSEENLSSKRCMILQPLTSSDNSHTLPTHWSKMNFNSSFATI